MRIEGCDPHQERADLATLLGFFVRFVDLVGTLELGLAAVTLPKAITNTA